MARKSTPQPLTLVEPTTVTVNHDQTANPHLELDLALNLDFSALNTPRSPLTPKSPRLPRSPFRFGSKRTQSELPSLYPADLPLQNRANLPPSQSLSAIQSVPAGQEKENRERPSRSGFFANYKAAKSASRFQNPDTVRLGPEEDMTRDTDRPAMAGKVSSKESGRTGPAVDKSITRRPVGGPSHSDASLDSQNDPSSSTPSGGKKQKPKPFSLLSRSKSLRDEKSPRAPSPNSKVKDAEEAQTRSESFNVGTPPTENDKSLKSMMSSTVRQRSEDRAPPSRDASRGKENTRREPVKGDSKPKMGSRENGRSHPSRDHGSKAQPSFGSSLREGSGHGFLNNLKSSAAKGAGALGKGLFGKGGRSGSTNEKEPVVDDEHYVLKVINRPLVEQTRLTRISKKLEDSRDKTEFWMPAFPWRAIDYLNYKGSDVEGLYRVPGSGPQIKKWQRRFDEEHDIDLFEQDDLYDINIIGSMLKAWLRELPDELFPKAAQDRIARECAGAETVPKLLIDELSNLSPFNYYLLFAITCHLSLLLAHAEKNKMDYRNLCICFQPCMKIDAFCFKFLVCDWRDCWKGCKTEPHYIEQEYMLFDMVAPPSAEGRSSTAIESHDERNVSSSDSSKPSTVSIDNAGKANEATPKKLTQSQSQSTVSSVATTLTVVQETTPPRKSNDMRPLSPIKPLSPIGF